MAVARPDPPRFLKIFLGEVTGAFPGQSSLGTADVYLRKFNFDGDLAWTRQFGTAQYDYGPSIARSPSGVYFSASAGHVNEQPESEDMLVGEFSAAGETLWTAQLNDAFRGFIAAGNSAVYVAGYTQNVLEGQSSSGGFDAYLAKLSPSPTAAPAKSGNEFRVNTTTALDQRFWEPVPEAVAMDADGDFVVTWSSQAQDGDGWGVFAQRYRADGTPAGSEFQVNSLAAANQRYSTVAIDPDGDFVITWSALANDTDNLGVYARRYNAAGVPQGEEFLVSPENTSFQRLSVAALDADGNLLIAWSELDAAGGENAASNIRARLFNYEGVALGPSFQVNTTTANQQRQASVARNEQGQFVIVWRSREQDGDNDGVFARVYASDGTPLTGELQINQAFRGQQIHATVAMDPSGSFVVAWYNQLLGDDSGAIVPREVYARRFAATGAPLGNEFRVNTTTAGDQRFPSIAIDQDGDFVIAWSSFSQDTSDWGIYAQAFDASGAMVGDEFLVNTTVANRQIYPAVAMDDEGDFVVAWQSLSQDGDGYGVYAQRYTQPLAQSYPLAASREIFMSNAPPEVVDFKATPITINEGGLVTVSGSVMDAGDLDIHDVLVDWGDGTSSLVAVNGIHFEDNFDEGSSPLWQNEVGEWFAEEGQYNAGLPRGNAPGSGHGGLDCRPRSGDGRQTGAGGIDSQSRR